MPSHPESFAATLFTFGFHPAGNGAKTATSYALETIQLTGAETMQRKTRAPETPLA